MFNQITDSQLVHCSIVDIIIEVSALAEASYVLASKMVFFMDVPHS